MHGQKNIKLYMRLVLQERLTEQNKLIADYNDLLHCSKNYVVSTSTMRIWRFSQRWNRGFPAPGIWSRFSGFKVSEQYFVDLRCLEYEGDLPFKLSGNIHRHGVTSQKTGKNLLSGYLNITVTLHCCISYCA